MSVDLFGRHLTENSRGHPGVGYKVTTDGQYSLDGKRLCKLADPKEVDDAVNLMTVRSIIQKDIQNLRTQLKSEIDNLDIIIDLHRDELDEKLRKLERDIKDLHDLIVEKLSSK